MRKAAEDGATHAAKTCAVLQLTAAYVALFLMQLSDIDYLLGAGQNLPVVSTAVPTGMFLSAAPVLIVLLHVRALLQWNLLRDRVASLIVAMRYGDGSQPVPTALSRMHPLVAIAAASSQSQPTTFARLAWVLWFVGLVIVPAGLLLWLLIRSLAFHEPVLSAIQRTIVVVDLVAMWALLGKDAFCFETLISRVSIAFTSAVLMFVLADAVIPDKDVGSLPEERNLSDLIRPRRLDLRGAVIGPKESASKGQTSSSVTLDLTCRDLRHSDMSSAVFRNVLLAYSDLSGANLENARFVQTNFRADKEESYGRCPVGTHVDFSGAQISNADFSSANLQGVNFFGVVGTGANFSGANLSRAQFIGASLDFSRLQAADLRNASLELASLIGADLRYAVLSQADLTAADLRGAVVFRNPVALTKLHLVDLSLARSAPLDESDEASLKIASEDYRQSFGASHAISKISDQDSMHADHPLYGVLTEYSYFAKYDFNPFLNSSLGSVPHDVYVAVLQAYIDSRVAGDTRLFPHIRRRASNSGTFLRMIHVRDRVPHIGEPNSPSLGHLQRLMVRGETLFEGHMLHAESLAVDDERLLRWNSTRGSSHSELAPAPWIKYSIMAVRANDLASKKRIIGSLEVRGRSGDTHALVAMTHMLTGEPESVAAFNRVLPMLRKVAIRPETRAVAARLVKNSDEQLQMISGSAQSSPLLDWMQGHVTRNWDLLRRSAEMRNVHASADVGIYDYFAKKVDSKERSKAWDHLAYAAYRGVAKAQDAVSTAMQVEGDCARAATWARAAAYSGSIAHRNNLALLLATCPDESVRDPARAIALAERNLRSGQAPFDALLSTAAAAYAADGRFARAVTLQTKAIAMLNRLLIFPSPRLA